MDCPWEALEPRDEQALALYQLLASPLCRDIPGIALLAADVVGLRRAPDAAGLFEDLMLIHTYRLKRADRAQPAGGAASDFIVMRRPRRR